MLSLTKKFVFIFFILILLPLISLSQNRQNKYYNPFRFSVSGLTKFVVGPNDHSNSKYLFDNGLGLLGELIYTLDPKAKYEISIEAGIMKTFSTPDNSSTEKPLIPISINAYYYFFDEEFSPFIGLSIGAEYLHNSNKYLLEDVSSSSLIKNITDLIVCVCVLKLYPLVSNTGIFIVCSLVLLLYTVFSIHLLNDVVKLCIVYAMRL